MGGGLLDEAWGWGMENMTWRGDPGWVPCRWQEVTVVESRRLTWAFNMLL